MAGGRCAPGTLCPRNTSPMVHFLGFHRELPPPPLIPLTHPLITRGTISHIICGGKHQISSLAMPDANSVRAGSGVDATGAAGPTGRRGTDNPPPPLTTVSTYYPPPSPSTNLTLQPPQTTKTPHWTPVVLRGRAPAFSEHAPLSTTTRPLLSGWLILYQGARVRGQARAPLTNFIFFSE